jgi:hypothetical protein
LRFAVSSIDGTEDVRIVHPITAFLLLSPDFAVLNILGAKRFRNTLNCQRCFPKTKSLCLSTISAAACDSNNTTPHTSYSNFQDVAINLATTALLTQSKPRARTTTAVHYVVPSCSSKRILTKTMVGSTIPAKSQKMSQKRKRMKNRKRMNTMSLRK